jgi:hypothetical protein
MPNTKPIGVAYEDQQLDGAVIGASGGTVGFYGTTPVARPATVAAVSTTAATTSTPFGYTTAEQADAIVTSLNSVIAHLKTLGLIAT